jgi:hypothetical protein
MTTNQDLGACSRQLIDSLKDLHELMDRTTDLAPARLQGIARDSQRILALLEDTQARLRTLGHDGLSATAEPMAARRALAAAFAEMPLGPGVQALREIAGLCERAQSEGQASRPVLMVPLSIAYRQCVEALVPLTTALDPLAAN